MEEFYEYTFEQNGLAWAGSCHALTTHLFGKDGAYSNTQPLNCDAAKAFSASYAGNKIVVRTKLKISLSQDSALVVFHGLNKRSSTRFQLVGQRTRGQRFRVGERLKIRTVASLQRKLPDGRQVRVISDDSIDTEMLGGYFFKRGMEITDFCYGRAIADVFPSKKMRLSHLSELIVDVTISDSDLFFLTFGCGLGQRRSFGYGMIEIIGPDESSDQAA